MNKVALVIIYNHQYNENIEILEQIYKGRFTDIYHLVPFYTGNKSNVIPVYCNSYYFQGYVAQAFRSFYKKDYTHYFFVADDMVLNPLINEKNYDKHLNLEQDACFLPGFVTLHERKEWWPRVGEAFQYTIDTPGVEAKKQLPSYDGALQHFKKFGLEIKPLKYDQIWNTPPKDEYLTKLKYNLSYPIVGSYSDIFVVSSNTIKQFSHYCGVFAATKLFVEVGLPTALVLSADKIVQEKDLKLQGKALWTSEDYSILEKFEGKLEKVLEDFPENFLYLHPFKLSMWNRSYFK